MKKDNIAIPIAIITIQTCKHLIQEYQWRYQFNMNNCEIKRNWWYSINIKIFTIIPFTVNGDSFVIIITSNVIHNSKDKCIFGPQSEVNMYSLASTCCTFLSGFTHNMIMIIVFKIWDNSTGKIQGAPLVVNIVAQVDHLCLLKQSQGFNLKLWSI